MSPSFGMQAIFAHDCRICTQQVDEYNQQDDSENANLQGFENFAICPGCHQEVPQELRTAAYQQRCLRRSRRRTTPAVVHKTTSAPALRPDQIRQGATAVTVRALATTMRQRVLELLDDLHSSGQLVGLAPQVGLVEALGWQGFLCQLAGRHELSHEQTIHDAVGEALLLVADELHVQRGNASSRRWSQQAVTYDYQCRTLGTAAANSQQVLEGVCRYAARDIFGRGDGDASRAILLNRAVEALSEYRTVFLKAKQAGLR